MFKLHRYKKKTKKHGNGKQSKTKSVEETINSVKKAGKRSLLSFFSLRFEQQRKEKKEGEKKSTKAIDEAMKYQ